MSDNLAAIASLVFLVFLRPEIGVVPRFVFSLGRVSIAAAGDRLFPLAARQAISLNLMIAAEAGAAS